MGVARKMKEMPPPHLRNTTTRDCRQRRLVALDPTSIGDLLPGLREAGSGVRFRLNIDFQSIDIKSQSSVSAGWREVHPKANFFAPAEAFHCYI